LGYGRGGSSTVNGEPKDDRRSDLLAGVSAGFPVGRSQGLTVGWVGRRRGQDVGADSDSFILG
jgi:hypothetical protein